VPGMTVLAPSSYEEVQVMLAQAMDMTSGPVAIRWPKTEARRARLTGSGLSARRVMQGNRACLLGFGKMVEACEGAAHILGRHGIEVTVWDGRVAAPLDPFMLDDALKHPIVVTVEDGIVEGGVGASIASALHVRAAAAPLPTLASYGLPLAFFAQGTASDILSSLGLDERQLAENVRCLCARRTTT
jgi:1-deoxy-D-xylulose-5-phosphate synthase